MSNVDVGLKDMIHLQDKRNEQEKGIYLTFLYEFAKLTTNLVFFGCIHKHCVFNTKIKMNSQTIFSLLPQNY